MKSHPWASRSASTLLISCDLESSLLYVFHFTLLSILPPSPHASVSFVRMRHTITLRQPIPPFTVPHDQSPPHHTNLILTCFTVQVGCAVVGIVSLAALSLLLFDMFKGRGSSNLTATSSKLPISTRTLGLQWMALGFMTVWILACNIAVTYIAVNNEAKTTAYLGGRQLSQALVEARERQLGVNPAYWSNDY
ncbi:9331_t:CDS:1, partial [Acaulospora colombiana]